MSERSVTTTKDIREAYSKNIGFYIPGYGHVTNFKNFYDNELAGQVSLKSLAEGARTNPKFIEEIDSVRNSVIKQYSDGGLNVSQSKENDDYKAQFDYIPQNKSTFADRFKEYKTLKEAEALSALAAYESLYEKIKKDKPNQYNTFKETFAAERRKAIKDGTLDTHTFEYTDNKTGETRLYHARTVNEQANWLKKRREEDDA